MRAEPTRHAVSLERTRRLGNHTFLVLVAVLAVALVSISSIAYAYWHGTGAGAGIATTGSWSSATGVTVPATSGSSVPVAWNASRTTPTGYYVTRTSGTDVTAACGSSLSALLTVVGCTDSIVPDGTYTYTVTEVFPTYSAASLPSRQVTVLEAAQLVFAQQPTNSAAGGSITPAVSVALQSTAGTAVARSGVTVTLALDPGPAGILGGRTSSITDADGIARFSALSVDRSGAGFTLAATSGTLGAAHSLAFSVSGGVFLGAASGYSILGTTGVTSTGTTTISGDVGVSPSTATTGFPPAVVTGTIHAGDAAAAAAHTALLDAYAYAAALTATTEFAGDLNGRTFTPGVYHTGSALALTGVLTLDGGGDPNAVFVIQVDAALNTAAASEVRLINGAVASNVFWQANGAAGTGANSSFSGTILANGAVTLGADSLFIGRALANGAVTLASNTIRFTEALPPTVTIAGGAAAVTKNGTPTISGTTNAAEGTTVTVSVGSATGVTRVAADGKWSVKSPLLAAGDYRVVASVRDAAGNGGSAVQQLTVEHSPAPVNLARAASFAVLATTGVVNTGATTVRGDLGVSPGTGLDGFPPGTISGGFHVADSTAADAQADLAAALDDAFSRITHTEFSGDLNGRTFHAGVYHSSAALALTGTLTLDGENNPDAVFIFQVDAALNTAAASSVVLVNGATAANVFWVASGAVGTGASSSFSGTVLSRGAITLGAGSTLDGRALAVGAVTLSTNTITRGAK